MKIYLLRTGNNDNNYKAQLLSLRMHCSWYEMDCHRSWLLQPSWTLYKRLRSCVDVACRHFEHSLWQI